MISSSFFFNSFLESSLSCICSIFIALSSQPPWSRAYHLDNSFPSLMRFHFASLKSFLFFFISHPFDFIYFLHLFKYIFSNLSMWQGFILLPLIPFCFFPYHIPLILFPFSIYLNIFFQIFPCGVYSTASIKTHPPLLRFII